MIGSRPRVLVTLLLHESRLVKTTKYREPVYLGDPVNTVRIFNEKGADELVLFDINATIANSEPQFELLEEIASEAFMPLNYGGGVQSIDQIEQILRVGFEKVTLNSASITTPDLVRSAADAFGSSTIVVAIDARRDRRGRYEVVTHGGRRRTGIGPVDHARHMIDAGAGELIITAVDRDGTMIGYDLQLIHEVASIATVPTVANGGGGTLADLRDAIFNGGAAAVAASSMFVYQGTHRAVLITYPKHEALVDLFAPSQ